MKPSLRATPLIALTVCALIIIVAQRTCLRAPERAADWQRASSFAQTHLTPTTRVIHHPHWDRAALPHFSPAASQALLHLERPLPEDLQGVTHALILSPADRLREALGRLPFHATIASERRFGDVAVATVPVPDALLWGTSLSSRIATATIEKVSGSKRSRCERFDPEQRVWRCSGDAPRALGARLREILDGPRVCIEGQPPLKGGALHVTFPEVPLQGTLRLRSGWTLIALRATRHKPTVLTWRVLVGEEVVDERTFAPDEDWHLIELDTSKWAGSEQAVRVEVRSPSPKHTMLCFDGWPTP